MGKRSRSKFWGYCQCGCGGKLITEVSSKEVIKSKMENFVMTYEEG